MSQGFDVVVVGAGPAGLQAALVLARARQAVAIVDAPALRRNRTSDAIHGCLGAEGLSHAAFRERAHQELVALGVEMHEDVVLDCSGELGHFVVTRAGGPPLQARRVLLATGFEDVLPAIDGLAASWGKSAFGCAFCHGFEHSDAARSRPWAILATQLLDVKLAPQASAWTAHLTIFTQGAFEVPASIRAPHERAGIRYQTKPITRILEQLGMIEAIEVEGGDRVVASALLHRPLRRPTALVRALAAEVDAEGLAVLDSKHRIRPGIFACGDVSAGPHQLVFAMADGARVATQLTNDLAWERVLGPVG